MKNNSFAVPVTSTFFEKYRRYWYQY